MTASKDGSMKIFLTNQQLQNQDLMPEFIYSTFDLNELFVINDDLI